jgi:hypothetical protein
MYCIYTDTEITKKTSSEEHIIPLSLGGSNAFTIIVDKEFNSKVGSEIDGKLSNDFIINMARSKRGIRGHSNKMVEMIWKQSNLNGDSTQPIQVTFPPNLNENVKIWNPKTRKYFPPEQTSGAKIQSKFILDRLIRVKFASKVALGAGYFVYGDLFRQHIEHSLLREVLAKDFFSVNKEHLLGMNLGVSDPFTPIQEKDKGLTGMFRAMCEMLDTCVLFLLCTENIIITVGILGEWIATLNVPGKTEYFPNSGDYDLGHTLSINNQNVTRRSFREMAELLSKTLNKKGTEHSLQQDAK